MARRQPEPAEPPLPETPFVIEGYIEANAKRLVDLYSQRPSWDRDKAIATHRQRQCDLVVRWRVAKDKLICQQMESDFVNESWSK